MNARLLSLSNGTKARLMDEPEAKRPTLILDFVLTPKSKDEPLYQLAISKLARGGVKSTLFGPDAEPTHGVHPTAKQAIVTRLAELGLTVN